MRKNYNLFSLALLLGLPLTATAQTAIGFETNDYKSIGVYDKWEHSPFRTGALKGNVKVVANPDTTFDAIIGARPDSSANVLAFQRSRFASNVFGARIDLSEPWATTPTTQYVHVMIHKPKAGRVMLMGLGKRTERADQSTETEQFWVKSANTVEADKWVDAVFAVKTANGVNIHSLVVVPDLEDPNGLTEDFAVYIDDIEINDQSMTRTMRENYPVNFDRDQKYTRNDRALLKVQLGDQVANVTSSAVKGQTPVYKMLSQTFPVKPGQTLTPKINYSGSWMDGYVYVDYDRDGRYSYNVNDDGTPAEGSDIKSYTYAAGHNSKGESLGEGNHVSNSYITCPDITIPAGTPNGLYLMRYKVDWDNLDPGGNISSNNNIVNNGGAIVDIRLNVHPDTVTITDANRNGDVLDAEGKPLGIKIPFGTAFTIKVRPENGFTYAGVRIRHGYNLDGDSLVHGVPQYVDTYVQRDEFSADNTYTIPADLIDGDVLVEGLFISDNYYSEDVYYPVIFGKDHANERTDRFIRSVSLGSTTIAADTKKMFTNATSQAFIARPGEEVDPGINYNGTWMNGYVYIDKDHSGFFDVTAPVDGQAVSADNEMVSYSQYNHYDSKGTQLSSQNQLDPPAFTIPADMEPGFYRMRFKVDWDYYDPSGRPEDGNGTIHNGGGVVDTRLCVHTADKVVLTDASSHGTLLVNGETLNGRQANFGEGLTVAAFPEAGYKLKSVTIRHGNLSGDSIQNRVAQYVDDVITGTAVRNGIFEVPASMVDGDMVFTAKFMETTAPLILSDADDEPALCNWAGAIKVARPVAANAWNAVCLPFAMTLSQVHDNFGAEAKVAEYAAIDGTTAKFIEKDSAVMEACVPYLVYSSNTLDTISLATSYLLYTATPQTVTHDGYSFTGNFTAFTPTAANCYELGGTTSDALTLIATDSTVRPFRAFLQTAEESAPTINRFTVLDNATGISNVSVNADANDSVYNLAGQRVSRSYRGFVVKNGKKYVNKK